MKKLLFLFLIFNLGFITKAQCDLVLTDVNIEEGTFTIEFLNTTSCGGTGGPDGVSEIQIGFQALDPDNDCAAMNQGWTFPSGITIPGDNSHPGWVFSNTSAEMPLSNWTNGWDDWPWDIDPPYYAGETITFPLYNQYQQDCSPGAFWADNLTCQLEDALNFWLDEGYSIQAVIWQISYGPTMYADEGGWAEVGPLGDGTTPGCCGIYEDNNFLDNWVIIGPCNESYTPGCTDPTACNYNEEATDEDGSCVYCDEELCDNVPAYCYGCIDPIALNYDENSQIDDGTCVYSTGPDLVPIEMVVTDQYCLEDGTTHVFQYQLTVVNVGTEDVGEFCATTFLSSNQYNCPTDIDINPGDTAIFLGSFQATWNSGQSNYVELDFVEGLNGEQEIVTGNNNLVFSMPEYEVCDYTDIEPGVLNITTQCAEESRYKLNFSAVNLGIDTISNYCYKYGVIDGPEFNDCVSSDGTYPTNNIIWQIPPGQDQFFTTGWIPYPNECGGEAFVEFYNVNGENIEDNNTITDWLPSNPCPPVDTLYIEVELPPDTIVETLIDTVYVPWEWYIYDTVYVDNFIYDTTYIEVIDTLVINTTDTLYIELPPDTITVTETEFIFITDTIYETDIVFISDTLYITLIDTIVEYQFIEVDCDTGLPCGENPGFDDCDPLTVFIPNTFTPNNDGYNDAWEIILFPECWGEVDAKVYNRWGGVIWESTDPYNLIWEGGFNNGDYYVPDGTYYWTFIGRKANSAYIEQLEGHVTIFR